MVLQLDGHEVACAYTAEDALERAPQFRPDVALLDVGLPRMSGYELARRLRELPGFDRVYLVALTGYGQPDDKANARSPRASTAISSSRPNSARCRKSSSA